MKKNLQNAQKQMGVFLDWSKSLVGVGLERSKQAVLDGSDSLLKTKFGQVVMSGADSMLSQVDGYLPQDQTGNIVKCDTMLFFIFNTSVETNTCTSCRR